MCKRVELKNSRNLPKSNSDLQSENVYSELNIHKTNYRIVADYETRVFKMRQQGQQKEGSVDTKNTKKANAKTSGVNKGLSSQKRSPKESYATGKDDADDCTCSICHKKCRSKATTLMHIKYTHPNSFDTGTIPTMLDIACARKSQKPILKRKEEKIAKVTKRVIKKPKTVVKKVNDLVEGASAKDKAVTESEESAMELDDLEENSMKEVDGSIGGEIEGNISDGAEKSILDEVAECISDEMDERGVDNVPENHTDENENIEGCGKNNAGDIEAMEVSDDAEVDAMLLKGGRHGPSSSFDEDIEGEEAKLAKESIPKPTEGKCVDLAGESEEDDEMTKRAAKVNIDCIKRRQLKGKNKQLAELAKRSKQKSIKRKRKDSQNKTVENSDTKSKNAYGEKGNNSQNEMPVKPVPEAMEEDSTDCEEENGSEDKSSDGTGNQSESEDNNKNMLNESINNDNGEDIADVLHYTKELLEEKINEVGEAEGLPVILQDNNDVITNMLQNDDDATLKDNDEVIANMLQDNDIDEMLQRARDDWEFSQMPNYEEGYPADLFDFSSDEELIRKNQNDEDSNEAINEDKDDGKVIEKVEPENISKEVGESSAVVVEKEIINIAETVEVANDAKLVDDNVKELDEKKAVDESLKQTVKERDIEIVIEKVQAVKDKEIVIKPAKMDIFPIETQAVKVAKIEQPAANASGNSSEMDISTYNFEKDFFYPYFAKCRPPVDYGFAVLRRYFRYVYENLQK